MTLRTSLSSLEMVSPDFILPPPWPGPPRNWWDSSSSYMIGPISSERPHLATMLWASSVARLMSLEAPVVTPDRKSTRLNSSHVRISYAVFCLKKKNPIFRKDRPSGDLGDQAWLPLHGGRQRRRRHVHRGCRVAHALDGFLRLGRRRQRRLCRL